MPLTDAQGTSIVQLARDAVERFAMGKLAPEAGGGEVRAQLDENQTTFLREKRGVFVTLKKLDGELRGCIGFPYPDRELGDAIVQAAIGASAHDPRFPSIGREELDEVLVEVSALTPPERIAYSSPKELAGSVRIGLDGLIVSAPGTSGLLLPQVASEYKMTPEDFLTHTCIKAGIMPDAWLADRTRAIISVYRFQAEVFSETSPRGAVRRELPPPE